MPVYSSDCTNNGGRVLSNGHLSPTGVSRLPTSIMPRPSWGSRGKHVQPGKTRSIRIPTCPHLKNRSVLNRCQKHNSPRNISAHMSAGPRISRASCSPRFAALNPAPTRMRAGRMSNSSTTTSAASHYSAPPDLIPTLNRLYA